MVEVDLTSLQKRQLQPKLKLTERITFPFIVDPRLCTTMYVSVTDRFSTAIVIGYALVISVKCHSSLQLGEFATENIWMPPSVASLSSCNTTFILAILQHTNLALLCVEGKANWALCIWLSPFNTIKCKEICDISFKKKTFLGIYLYGNVGFDL